MRRVMWLAVVGVALVVALWSTNAQARTTWGPEYHTKDCSGGSGCLTIYYNIATGQATGVRLNDVDISTGGGTFANGVDGQQLECWNDAGDVKWSKDGSQTNLPKNAQKGWAANVAFPNTTKMTCRWFYKSLFFDGPPIPGCVKDTVRHNLVWSDDTGC